MNEINSKYFFISLLLFLGLFFFFFACGNDDAQNKPEKKAKACISASQSQNIYNILKDYPGLEQFFIYGNLEIAEYERRLFGDFLGNTSTADIILSMIDMFPALIDTGDFKVSAFSSEVQAEMAIKGPVPDFVSAIANLTQNVVSVQDEKIKPFYDYLEKLDFMGKSIQGKRTIIDYSLDMLLNISSYLKTLDEESVNRFMKYQISDLLEMKVVEDGNIDFADFEKLLEKFAFREPQGLVKIFEGTRLLFYDKEFKKILSELLNNLGDFFGDKELSTILKNLRLERYTRYDVETLGEFLERLWVRGPKAGPNETEIGIEKYGKDGKKETALLDFLMQPDLVGEIFEVIHNFNKNGARFEDVDEILPKLVSSDPFMHDRKGDGEFGSGNFYEPSDKISYKDISWINGMLSAMNKINQPATLMAPLLYESDERSKDTQKIIKMIMPEADKFPLASLLWFRVVNKDPNEYFGHTTAITEKMGGGVLVDGELYAPLPPNLQTISAILAHGLGICIFNGPYDNLFDNFKYATNEAKIAVIVDIIKIMEYIPALKSLLLPYFKATGIKQLPVKLGELYGCTGLLGLELNTFIKKIPINLTNGMLKADIPEWMVNSTVEIINKFLPLGNPHGTKHNYLFPQVIQDLAITYYSCSYFDSDAFYPERFLDLDHPENYRLFFDVRDYSFEKDKEKANPFAALIGSFAVAAYNINCRLMEPYFLTFSAMEKRKQIAFETWGTYAPYDSLINAICVITEITSEESIYDKSANDLMPFVKMLEPLMTMKSHGVLDKTFELLAEFGKPELKGARDQILSGLSKILSAVDRNSKAPYTYAESLINNTRKAIDDPFRWEGLTLTLTTISNMLSADSYYEIVNDSIQLLEYLTDVEVTSEEWSLASEGLVDILGQSVKDKIFTRGTFHLVTILDEIDKYHIWKDAIIVLNEIVVPDGIVDYLLRGLERDPEYAWENIFSDANLFLHSNLMNDYCEGSFWKDVYYFLEFLSNAIE